MARVVRSRRTRRASSKRSSPSSDKTVRLALDHGRVQAERVIRAQEKRRRAVMRAPTLPQGLLIAEGDSWFDYPLVDVLDELEDTFGYGVESVAHKGDTVEEMAYDASQLAGLVRKFQKLSDDERTPRAILLSGGGNDVAGDEFAVLLNHKQSGLTALNDWVVKGILEERLLFAVVSLASQVTELSKRYFDGRVTPVFLHGYDYPVPDGRGYLSGFWVLPGPWLEPGFRQKGYEVLAQRCEIMVDLIDRFNAVLKDIPAHPGLGHVRYVDLRGTLSNELAGNRYKQWWANELHPTEGGYRAVAGKFHTAISTVPMP
jgi:lysophospholipase L1-like esterase